MKKSLQIASAALTSDMLIPCSEYLSEEEIDRLAMSIDWNEVPDSDLASNKFFAIKFKWSKYIEKMRALRITVGTPDYINYVSFEGYDFKISEIIKSIKVNPEILNKVKIKIDALNKGDMLNIMSSGHDRLLEIVSLDEYNINMVEKFRILEVFKFSEKAIDAMDIIGSLEDNPIKYYIRQVIKYTGDKYIDYLDINRLMPTDWLDILNDDPYMISYIDIDDFLVGDIYYLIQLCYIYPEYIEYITKENAHKISSLGWEELLIYFSDDHEELIDLCDFSELEERSWVTFQREKPSLMQYKL